MHLALLLPILTLVWALAPFFGSPASLAVMPLVAVLAAAGGGTIARAVGASLASLGLLALAWSALAIASGAEAGEQARLVVAIVAFHAPVVAALAAGAGWARPRVAARWQALRVGRPHDKRG